MKYDLTERTLSFSVKIINFVGGIKVTYINKSLLNQLIRSATSVGANYREANNASSRMDFKNKISISRKEINETKYWLDLLSVTNPTNLKEIALLQKETYELSLIFNKIYNTMRNDIRK